MPLLHGASLRALLAGAAVAHLSSFPIAPKRNHPLMLLSGVATNAVGFDLSPGASFARHMSMQGFDTWIVELRGAGLSTRGSELAAASTKSDMSSNSGVDKILTQKVNVVPPTKDMLTNEPQSSEVPVLTDTNVLETNTSEEPQLVTKLANALAQLSVTFSGYVRDSQLRSITDSFFDRVTELVPDASLTSLEEVADKFLGLMELPQTSAIYDQISQLSQRLVKILGEGQQNVSPRLFGWQERLSATIEDLQKQLELIISYDWDFDHYLEEDVPAAIDYIKQQSVPKDGKLLAIGHSMGGILLYAMVSKCDIGQILSRLERFFDKGIFIDGLIKVIQLCEFTPGLYITRCAHPLQATSIVSNESDIHKKKVAID
uniref:Serine aminopeptidase S33 domain-containing protein n=1 Tax=Aegilops tauschii TaxID=37682 RepID=M8CEP8_AEGTA